MHLDDVHHADHVVVLELLQHVHLPHHRAFHVAESLCRPLANHLPRTDRSTLMHAGRPLQQTLLREPRLRAVNRSG
jgi:hypothetical protein